jgi:hypothetical protein
MSRKHFLGLASLLYLATFFPTAAVLILQHRRVEYPPGTVYPLAYWIINGSALLGAWFLANAFKDRRFYNKWRRLIAAIGFAIALTLADVAFPILLEGPPSPKGVVVFYLIVLGFLVSATGFLGTYETLDGNYHAEDLEGARNTQKIAAAVAALPLGGSVILELIKGFARETWEDKWLFAGSMIVAITIVITLFGYPYAEVKAVRDYLRQQPTKS